MYKVIIKQKTTTTSGYELLNEIMLHREELKDALCLIEDIIDGQDDIEFALTRED